MSAGYPPAVGTVPCRVCKEPKTRERIDERNSQGDFVYVDERNRRWNGHECPDCRRKRATDAQRRRRDAKRLAASLNQPAPAPHPVPPTTDSQPPRPNRQRTDPAKKAAIIAEYLRGDPLREVAARHGYKLVSLYTLLPDWLKEAGITFRRRKPMVPRTGNPAYDAYCSLCRKRGLAPLPLERWQQIQQQSA